MSHFDIEHGIEFDTGRPDSFAQQRHNLRRTEKAAHWKDVLDSGAGISWCVLVKRGGFAPDVCAYWDISEYEIEVADGVVRVHDRHLGIPVAFYGQKGWVEIGLVRKQGDGSWIEYRPGIDF